MPSYMLIHQHRPEECRHVFAAWSGFGSPLRHQSTVGSCVEGGHRLWWKVQAQSAAAALAQLPPYVAARTEVAEVRDTPIP